MANSQLNCIWQNKVWLNKVWRIQAQFLAIKMLISGTQVIGGLNFGKFQRR